MSNLLHIAMYPWFAVGHFIPYLHLANELAARGHKISYLVPNKALLQLRHLSLRHDLITFHPVAVPHVDGLPPGTETVSDIPLSLNHELATAMDLTRDQVRVLLSETKPDLVLHDFAHWIPNVARQLGIRSVGYHVVSATTLAFAFVPARYVPTHRPMTEEEIEQPPLGYPSSTVVLRGNELSSFLFLSRPFGQGMTSYDRLTASMKSCDAIAVRSCRELGGKFCDYVETQYGKPVLLTGSALPEYNISSTAMSSEDRWWAEWLDGFEPSSVVFCSFGSQYILEMDQFQELVLAFEQTGLPFFVALKPPAGCATIEEGLPRGFQQRVEDRGVVYGGWIQQLPRVLRHPSVGCFVNHCGSGSAWECLMSDPQIVLLPRLADHILYAKLLVEDLKVAVMVDKNEKGWFPRECLCRAIKCVMDKDSEVGLMVKNNHAKLKQVLEKPGFMSGYIDKFIHNLQELVA